MKYLGSKTDSKDLVSLEKLLSYGTTLGAASNALTLKNSAGTVLSTLTAANLVTVLGNTPVSRATGDASGNSIESTYLKLSGGSLNNSAKITLTEYGNRHLILSGNTIVLDMSEATGGWAGSMVSLKDPMGNAYSAFGFYGGTSGLNYFYMGSPYNSPAAKIHPDNSVEIINSKTFTPLTDNTYNIGSKSKKWANVYATTFHGALDGNADTATILKTARTIWGQSFNGSANVSGALSGVTSLTMSGALSGATTGSFSSNLTVGGTLTMSGSSKRIYFGTDYIELVTVNGVKCLHSNVGFYSDSFVSAGGIGSGGGGGSIVNVKSLSEVLAYSGSEVMTDVPTAYAVHSMYNTFNTAITDMVKTQSTVFPPGSIALWTGTGKNLMTGQSIGNASKPIYLEDGIPKACTHTIGADVPSSAVFTDTKNTAGSSNKNGTKMFLVAATSQAANPQTYSNAGCYIGTDNCLYSGGEKVATVGDTPSSNQKQPWKVVVKRACPVFALRQGYLYYTASYAQAEHNGDDTVGMSIVVRPGHCGKKVLVPEGLAEYLEDRLRHFNDGFAEIIYEAMSYEPSEYEGMVWLRLGDIDEIQFGHAGVIVLYNILPCACFGFRGTEWVCRGYGCMPRSFSTASPFLNVEHGIVTTTKTVPVTIINGLRNAVISNMLRNSKDRGRKKHGVMVTRNVSWKGNFIRPGGRIAARKGFRYVRNGDSNKWKMYCGPVRFYAVHRGVKSPIFSEVTRTMHRR